MELSKRKNMTKKDLYHYRKCYGTYKAIAPFEIIERNSYREALKLLFHLLIPIMVNVFDLIHNILQ